MQHLDPAMETAVKWAQLSEQHAGRSSPPRTCVLRSPTGQLALGAKLRNIKMMGCLAPLSQSETSLAGLRRRRVRTALPHLRRGMLRRSRHCR
jgi:hypothetical protein